jgi:hypothetical protein
MSDFRPFLYIGGAVMAVGITLYMLYLGFRLEKISGYPIYVRMAYMTYGLPCTIAAVYFVWRIFEILSIVPDLLLIVILLSPLLGNRFRKHIEEDTRNANPTRWKKWEEKSKTIHISGMIRPLLPGGDQKPAGENKSKKAK